jgi:hypothetical protein
MEGVGKEWRRWDSPFQRKAAKCAKIAKAGEAFALIAKGVLRKKAFGGV